MGKKEENAILRTARGILEKYTVCDQCLGRQFAWLSTDTSNEERGNAIKLALSMTADHYLKSGSADEGKALLRILAGHGMFQPAQSLASRQALEFSSQNECHLCQHKGTSVFERIPSIAETTEKLVKGVEFNSFLVGCVPDPLLSERQDELRAEFGLLHGEALKADFNRELGKHLQTTLGKQVDFASPDLVILYNMERDSVKLNINPAFVYGKYRKLARGIPQSRWDCKECRGKGCEECGGTGRRYQDSISEYIGEPVKESMRGSKFKFHAAGREDIDVLMLGSGRPFVVEISEPRVRSPDFDRIAKRIRKQSKRKVEVSELELTNRKRAQNLKDEASQNIKEYEAIISVQGKVSKEDLNHVAEEFSGLEIQQRTPARVAHRRSDLVRTKQIYEVRLEKKREGKINGFFKVQGGTYVKELISGDDGRTTPSIAEKLGVLCECQELTVIAIYD